jgi:predicted pyridoxine 5'-phosphate oxidase superfamily flavin-nucleotide-binding protein
VIVGASEPAFHSGERAVQARVGVAERLARVGDRAIRRGMPEQHRQFFQLLPFVLIGSIDRTGQPWASVLAGKPGFVSSPDTHTLCIRTSPTPGDPLIENLHAGAQVGVLGLQPHTRRRNRANGVVSAVDHDGFAVTVMQSFGNCPKYIQAREPRYVSRSAAARFEIPHTLSESAIRLIRGADTFLIATAHPDATRGGSRAHGVDVSHRGGRPGFVGLDESGRLTVPDFVGNFFFNTLGNVELHPFAGLLFMDYESGDLLSVAATVAVIWDGPEVAAFEGAQRLVRFTPREIRSADAALPLQWGEVEPSPHLAGTGTW